MTDPYQYAKSEKHEQQILDIVDAAIELYAKSGMDGLSMREIARKTGMSAKNIYNYIQSKREIFIAMREKYLKTLEESITEICVKESTNAIDTILEIAQTFMAWASENEEGFNILFLSEPPNSNQIGPIEKQYESGRPLIIFREFLQSLHDKGEIPDVDLEILTAYIWQYVYGAAYVERGIVLTKHHESTIPNYGREKNPIYMQLDPQKYRDFTLENLYLQLVKYFKEDSMNKNVEKKIAFIEKWVENNRDNKKLHDYWLWLRELNEIEKINDFYQIIQNNITSIEKNLVDIVKSIY